MQHLATMGTGASVSATFIGFDSGWTDREKAPGAICGLSTSPDRPPVFHQPRLVCFAQALEFIRDVGAGSDFVLVALDQPTVVPNHTGMRPVERVAASVVSWVGGGVQPANRGKVGMFCGASPIWAFLASLGATEDPIAARSAAAGVYLMEVFPALALPSLEPAFCRRLGAPKYNLANPRQYQRRDWDQVCAAAATCFARWGMVEGAAWCGSAAQLGSPCKADQDRLDAMLCLAVALHWRLAPADQSTMIGDVATGYIVTPVAPAIRERLTRAAAKHGVRLSG